MKAFWDGTLMRYFLFYPLSVTLLSSGIIDAAHPGSPVLFSRTLAGLCPGKPTTPATAIALSAITARTDNDLGMTTTTMIKAAGRLHRQKCR
jgi:hypothetical protein